MLSSISFLQRVFLKTINLISSPEKSNMSRQSSPERKNDGIPKIYVEEAILKKYGGDFEKTCEESSTPIFDKVYEINGLFFRETQKDDNKLVNFEVQLKNSNKNKENMASEQSLYMDINVHKMEYGMIINSNILVSEAHWHTILKIGENLTCFVCDILVESIEHVTSVEHEDNLNKCKPLKEFDLNITRMIADHYHCAICNEVFHKNNEKEHFSSKSHEEKMLYATNRASDVIYDFNLRNEENILRDNKNDFQNKENDESRNGNQNEVYHFDRNRILSTSEQSEQSGQSGNEYESSEGFYEYDFSNDVDTGVDNRNEANSAFSYASVAKKPAVASKYVVSDDKKMKIKFDVWHMINKLKNNKFYCIACKCFGHIAQKAQHCLEEDHQNNVSKCQVVDKYKKYFVRQVDLKHYHCPYCNSLQVMSYMDYHIQSVHNPKHKNDDADVLCDENIQNDINFTSTNHEISRINNQETLKESQKNDLENPSKNDGKNSSKIDIKDRNVIGVMNPINIARMEMILNNVLPSIFNDIIINQFNYNFRVSFLSYNAVVKSYDFYFCGICNFGLPENFMITHVYDKSHVDKLRMIPFNQFYGVNLIRLINYRVHCTLCNVYIDMPHANIHVNHPFHLNLLNQARRVPQPTKICPNIDSNTPKYQDIDSNNSKNQHIGSNQSKNQPNVDLNESFESVEQIDTYVHEYVFLKLGKSCVKVTYNAYNSLVPIGDGTRYCFVCSVRVFEDLKNHTESRTHNDCMQSCKFLDNYEKHLLRQMYSQYHCSVCNVMFSKKDLAAHLTWNTENNKGKKKMRKRDLKSGIKSINVSTQKEVDVKEQESTTKIIGRFEAKAKCKNPNIEVKKKNKIVTLGGTVLKISWDYWQGFTKNKYGYNCLLCDKDVKDYEISSHIANDWHTKVLDQTFDKQHFPYLIRQVNDTTVNCVTCNIVFSNKKHIISEHLNSQKHKKRFDNITRSTSADYTDCKDDVLHL